jgi:hypothetical protein
MALLDAPAGSMMDSVIFVTVKSRFAGRKDLTPESRFSKFAPTPVSLREEVRREEMLLKPRKRSVEVVAWEGEEVGAEVIIVMRVVARTLWRIRGVE